MTDRRHLGSTPYRRTDALTSGFYIQPYQSAISGISRCACAPYRAGISAIAARMIYFIIWPTGCAICRIPTRLTATSPASVCGQVAASVKPLGDEHDGACVATFLRPIHSIRRRPFRVHRLRPRCIGRIAAIDPTDINACFVAANDMASHQRHLASRNRQHSVEVKLVRHDLNGLSSANSWNDPRPPTLVR